MRRSLLLTLLALGACARPGPSSGTPTAPSGEGAFHRPPVVDGSRHACLEPPFTPGASTTLGDGAPVTRGEDGRSWIVAIPGERSATPDEIHAALGALRERPGLRFLSHGAYCGDRLCLHLEGNLCEARVDDVVRDVQAGLGSVPALAGSRVDLHVALAGHLGPRCAPTDRACAPVPYQDGARFDPLGSRIGGAHASHSGGACAHDGDCMVMGCGNHCLSWEHGGANEAATCEGYSFPQPIFCGCVDDVCQWFRQR